MIMLLKSWCLLASYIAETSQSAGRPWAEGHKQTGHVVGHSMGHARDVLPLQDYHSDSKKLWYLSDQAFIVILMQRNAIACEVTMT